jgi:hypothetical protein
MLASSARRRGRLYLALPGALQPVRTQLAAPPVTPEVAGSSPVAPVRRACKCIPDRVGESALHCQPEVSAENACVGPRSRTGCRPATDYHAEKSDAKVTRRGLIKRTGRAGRRSSSNRSGVGRSPGGDDARNGATSAVGPSLLAKRALSAGVRADFSSSYQACVSSRDANVPPFGEEQVARASDR